MNPNTEKLRKKYIDNPPEGMTSGDIKPVRNLLNSLTGLIRFKFPG